MNLIIVSWNIQGQFSLSQLIDRMIENGWDLLIVLEPQRAARVEVSHPGIAIARVHVGDQYIYVLAATTISACRLSAQTIMSGERNAVVIDVVAHLGASYRILTAHAPYRNNDGTAQQYQQAALNWGRSHSVDLILGDLNTYGSRVGSSSRSCFRNLSEGLATSRGGSQLDKALLRDDYYGLPSDVNADVMEIEDIEIPEVSYVQTGSRASQRSATAQSRQGRRRTPDHRPVVVMLPAARLMSSKSPSSSLAKRPSGAATAIGKDGHCLYRCIAHIVWGDQDRYGEVRRRLAGFALANWERVPYLQHLHNIGQLNVYASIIRNTNAWGGEFELATLAQLYGLRITMHSRQGYAQAVYGNGPAAASIRHTGDHFEVL